MTSPTFKFSMPIPKKVTANKVYAGIHWGTRKSIADKYHKAISDLKLKYRAKNIVDIKMVFYFKNRPLDCTNLFFMAKVTEDGMVRAGVLKDDTPEYVRSITCMSCVDKKNPRIEIEIREDV